MRLMDGESAFIEAQTIFKIQAMRKTGAEVFIADHSY